MFPNSKNTFVSNLKQMKLFYTTLLVLTFAQFTKAQDTIQQIEKTSPLEIASQQPKQLPVKVKHAEPLYIDLMRDLGARKGEAEFNIGYGIAKYKNKREQNAFIEYEWAAADRLGLEVEIPLSFTQTDQQVITNRIDGIKLATQYTFLVNEKHQTSLAIGYMHEMEFVNQRQFKKESALFKGFVATPFFIAAKNFNQFSTLIYTGPEFEYDFKNHSTETKWALNASVHYMIPNSSHFIGIENNLRMEKGYVEYIMRPQIKIGILHNLAIGIVSGIPIKSKEFELDFMTRIIWEPNF